jgi:serine/threonine protein kinase
VHRDIKPENILYDEKTKQIKIIDFGISRRFKRRGSRFEMWTITGTLFYRAPEMFSGGYREGVDIWAVGILIFQLVCGRTPFESEYHSQTIKNIQETELVLSKEFSRYSHELRSLLLRMLTRNPEERVDACSCLRDPWLSDLPLRRMKSQKTLHSKEKENSFAVNYRPCKHSDKAKAEMSMTINEDILKECNSNKDIFLGRPHLRKIEGSQIEFIESDPHV